MFKKTIIGNLEKRETKQQDSLILSKITKKKSTVRNVANNPSDRMHVLQATVETNLKDFLNITRAIREEKELVEYVDKVIEQGICAYDTETTGLDCLNDLIIGACLYAPNLDGVYIPLRHKSYITGSVLERQLPVEFFVVQLKRIIDADVKIIMHNAKFDIRMSKSNFGIYVPCYWDTMLCAQVINNLEPAKLKFQYAYKVLGLTKEEASNTYDFDKLFKDFKNELIPIKAMTPYASADPIETYRLYLYQKDEIIKYSGLYYVFKEIEMPILDVIVELEDAGILIDVDYAKKLSEKYHKLLDKALEKAYAEMYKYEDAINSYNLKNAGKLSNPINLSSPAQLSIYFYDILQIGVISKKEPRGTGDDILKKINSPFSNALAEVRSLEKLIGTYIDKLPKVVNKDGRIHAAFVQMGADTGRMSSRDPNLQNIPAKNKEIRKMFSASKGYKLISKDFSQQEPRLLAEFSKDKDLIQNYKDDRDIYATVGSICYNSTYDNCLEFYPNGFILTVDGKKITCGYKTHINKDGKKRRNNSKSILLGLIYGRQPKSIAEQTGLTLKEAQSLIDTFYNNFKGAKQWTAESQQMARDLGYVETLWGRRRQIPDMQLPKYEFKFKHKVSKNFNPIDFTRLVLVDDAELEDIKRHWTKKLDKAWGREKQNIIIEAKKEGIDIIDNSMKLADAERQCVNSRIQGSAADLSKLAMIQIHRNKRLKELKYRMLIPVHDEIIGECPEENVDECSAILDDIMIHCAMGKCSILMKVDTDITTVWYENEKAA